MRPHLSPATARPWPGHHDTPPPLPPLPRPLSDVATPFCHPGVPPRLSPASPSAAHADGPRPRTLPLQGWGRSRRPSPKPPAQAVPIRTRRHRDGHSHPGGSRVWAQQPLPGQERGWSQSTALLAALRLCSLAMQLPAPSGSPQQDQELPSWVSPQKPGGPSRGPLGPAQTDPAHVPAPRQCRNSTS